MSHPLDRSVAIKQQRQQTQQDKAREEQFRRDVQLALTNKATRAVLNRFFDEAGLDTSAFNPHGSIQAHALGKQDAAKWWINVIREHCPEQEVVLRIEAKNAVLEIVQEEEQNEH